MTPPSTPATDDLWGLIPKPIAVVLAVLLVGGYVITELSGKLKGPINWLLARREVRRPVPPDAQQAAEIASLRNQVGGLVGDVRRLQTALDHQNERLDDAQQREEIRDHLAAEHRRWDVAVVNKLIDLGVEDMPDPPPLHVHPDFKPRRPAKEAT